MALSSKIQAIRKKRGISTDQSTNPDAFNSNWTDPTAPAPVNYN
jgi:hypothetical protein